ncbi:plasmid partitioning protein RepB [Mesorhizobium sp. M1B.F.Ca.ET.045.04.1.1]|uniref:plasmid partitioning protein RepB n=1 Tax=Mesorhizobium sp. M1B.F.Ca.ET.045.04.1.1 TaxID=2493673 RepID=UPI000F75FD6B|nr:plasmid partitioning protein RepB [Mesorhizobium sp. M1B.F.Ca.ET.045.04.1.1]AZO32377.1 plasmid partitioning protein RepB [Mesorhizobium sp. M1B.F.Ca.ET.045.04.1.1]
MARKNIFNRILAEDDDTDVVPDERFAAMPKFGAAKSISSSIDELTKQAALLADGEAIIEIDPAVVDGSFVSDRMTVNDEQYAELVEAIRARGQDTPILVRPHPSAEGRYMVVFGHRRLRAASELGRKVRAVVKTLEDLDHVIAQGQENSARANLSFIEKVVFAQQLDERGFGRETIQSALSVDYQTLSKMMTIPKSVPAEIIDGIGAAKGIGRDRWLELRKLIDNPRNAAAAKEFITTDSFLSEDTDGRFNKLFDALHKGGKAVRKTISKPVAKSWAPSDKIVSVTTKIGPKDCTLKISKAEGKPFGEWISDNLDSLFEAYRRSKQEN